MGISDEYTDFREVFADLSVDKDTLYRKISKDEQLMRKIGALFKYLFRYFQWSYSQNSWSDQRLKNDLELYTVQYNWK